LDGTAVPAASGADLSTQAEPTAAIRQTRYSGATALSAAYVLQQDLALPVAQRQLSFVLAAPVLGAAGPESPQGWMLVSLRGQDFLGATLRSVTQGVLDASLQATDGQARLVRVAEIDNGRRPSLRRRAAVTVTQRQWVLETAADPAALPGGRTPLPLTLGAGGSLFTMLLAGLVYLLTRLRARARGISLSTGQQSA
jgi:hypothetical protein